MSRKRRTPGLLAFTTALAAAAAVAASATTLEGCVGTRAPGEPDGYASTAAALSDDGGGTPARGSLVISQVYGGGGLSGATLDHDFVELLNVSATPLSLDGLALQYADAESDFGSADGSIIALSGTIAPQQYVLVALAGDAAADGAPLLAGDITGTVDLDEVAGKIALAPSTTALGCGSSVGTRCAATKVLDIVGYGLVSDFEGAQPVLPLSRTKAAIRAGSGCTDANNNRADFTVGTPAPRNMASSVASCPTPPPPTSKEAGGPAPPVVDPPLGPDVEGDSGAGPRDAGSHAPGAAASGCSVAVAAAAVEDRGTGSLLPALLGSLGVVLARRRRRVACSRPYRSASS